MLGSPHDGRRGRVGQGRGDAGEVQDPRSPARVRSPRRRVSRRDARRSRAPVLDPLTTSAVRWSRGTSGRSARPGPVVAAPVFTPSARSSRRTEVAEGIAAPPGRPRTPVARDVPGRWRRSTRRRRGAPSGRAPRTNGPGHRKVTIDSPMVRPRPRGGSRAGPRAQGGDTCGPAHGARPGRRRMQRHPRAVHRPRRDGAHGEVVGGHLRSPHHPRP